MSAASAAAIPGTRSQINEMPSLVCQTLQWPMRLCSHRFVSFPLSFRAASLNSSSGNGAGVNMPRLINDRSDGACRILSRIKNHSWSRRGMTKLQMSESLEISGRVGVALAACSITGLLACVCIPGCFGDGRRLTMNEISPFLEVWKGCFGKMFHENIHQAAKVHVLEPDWAGVYTLSTCDLRLPQGTCKSSLSLASRHPIDWIETTLDPPPWALTSPCTALNISPAPMKSPELRCLENDHVSIWSTKKTLKTMPTSSESWRLLPAILTTRSLALITTMTLIPTPAA
ncbi:hypothetical protein AC578_1678 [Pseudocercospora eumusae]|uniref:Uncharacterized protein n=1 Tax=Pseudocercospora eumusae TaxID=321146 RepID=A0A139GXE9_9PEZI|nr:hypothetical protein AC578_1678 [Pseudocercospora eumusae]